MKWFGTPFQIIHTFSKSDFSFTIEKHDLVEDGFDKLLPKLHLKGLKMLLENGVFAGFDGSLLQAEQGTKLIEIK